MRRLADEIRVRREKRINEVLEALRLPDLTKEEKGSLTSTFTTGLRENQWIALAAVLTGICITALPSALPVKPSGAFDLAFFAATAIGGIVTAFAMSMDFPKSTLRFSRLSGEEKSM